MGVGIVMDREGNEATLHAWTDAGFSGLAGSASQTGLVITWAGSVLVWRSSRQSIIALSTAEAELYAAALGWSIIEGLRHLLEDLGIVIPKVKLEVDNKAAITVATCGGTWRTRYFAVRGHRLHQEHQNGKVDIGYCKTGDMVADCLTKLAAHESIACLGAAMHGSAAAYGNAVSEARVLSVRGLRRERGRSRQSLDAAESRPSSLSGPLRSCIAQGNSSLRSAPVLPRRVRFSNGTCH